MTYAAGQRFTSPDALPEDLRGTDLRGATLWLTGSIEAETDGVRVWPVEDGAVQIGYLLVLAALVLLGIALVRVVRGVPSPGSRSWRRLRPRARVTLGLVPVAGLVTLFVVYPLVNGLAAIWAVDVIAPLLITAGVLIVTAAVEQAAP